MQIKIVTVEDYRRSLEIFLSGIDKVREDIASVLLFGSMVRGDIKPGSSDIMDAAIFLKQEVFEDQERFTNVLEKMVELCQQLSQLGLPFDPFIYWHEADPIPTVLLQDWSSNLSSRVICGEDTRPAMRDSESSKRVAKASFFETRRSGHPMAEYLEKEFLCKDDMKKIIDFLISSKKRIPRKACLALDIWFDAVEIECIKGLATALQDLDIGIFEKIENLRTCPAHSVQSDDLRKLLRETLNFIENLHDKIIASIRTGNKVLQEVSRECS